MKDIYLKKINVELLEMKITMSGMKNILEEISSLLDIAEEKMDTFAKSAMGNYSKMKYELRKKKGTFQSSSYEATMTLIAKPDKDITSKK